MKKNIYVLIRNLMLAWVIIDVLSGVTIDRGPIGYLIVCGFFGLLRVMLPNILRFFKFAVNFWGKLIIGSLFTFAYLALFHSIFTGIIEFGKTYIGGTDYVIFSTPIYLTITNPWMVILLTAICMNICSIILASLAKSKI